MIRSRQDSKKYYPKVNITFFLIIIFTSCVYYNTFYNAEKSFESATKIIEESPLLNESEIPPQAKKLLDESIANSNIVLEKYYDSKYVDDAFFIISKSRFLKSEYLIAIEYLNRLITEFPNSEYINQAKIWRTYSIFKTGLIDSAKISLNEITTSTKLLKSDRFIISKIKAEIALSQNDILGALKFYEEAIELTRINSNKVSIYMKLVDIAEKNNLISDVIVYLEKLSQISSSQIKLDTKLDWIQYSRQLGNYNEIITEINNLLGKSEYQSIHMKLELEQGKVYLDKKDFETAKLLLSDFTSSYERKNETAEAFYHLGYIALMEDFDLILARDYFDSAKNEKSNSKFGKKAKDMKVVIEQFSALQDEYDLKLKKLNSNEQVEVDSTLDKQNDLDEDESFSRNRNDISMPNMRPKVDASPDSLLFTIAEKLMFDFNKQDLAVEKFKFLINNFPNSKFRSQSIFVLSHFFPLEKWENMLFEEYPESAYMYMVDSDSTKSSSITSKRDSVWDIVLEYPDSSINLFYDLFNTENDTISLYYYAYVLDYYSNDLEGALKNYQKFTTFDYSSEFNDLANNRIEEIKQSISKEEEYTTQRINYSKAINAYFSGESIDSTITNLDIVIKGPRSNYKNSAQQIKSSFTKIQNLNKLLKPDTTSQTNVFNSIMLDSIYYNLGDIFEYELGISDSAKNYYKKVLNNYENSNYRFNSLIAMTRIDTSSIWNSLISSEFPDSIVSHDTTRTVKRIIDSSFDEKFILEQKNILNMLTETTEVYFDNQIDTLFDISSNDSENLENEFPKEPISTKEFALVDKNVKDSSLNDLEVKSDSSFILKNDSINYQIPITDKEKSLTPYDLISVKHTTESDEFIFNAKSNIKEEIYDSDLNNQDIVLKDSTEKNGDIKSYNEIPADSSWSERVVFHGESLRSISMKEYGTESYWSLIYEWNKDILGNNPELIFPYQVIKLFKENRLELHIPNNSTYVVKEGETLWSIARLVYNDEYAWLILAYDNKNMLLNPNNINPGNELVIRGNINN